MIFNDRCSKVFPAVKSEIIRFFAILLSFKMAVIALLGDTLNERSMKNVDSCSM